MLPFLNCREVSFRFASVNFQRETFFEPITQLQDSFGYPLDYARISFFFTRIATTIWTFRCTLAASDEHVVSSIKFGAEETPLVLTPLALDTDRQVSFSDR